MLVPVTRTWAATSCYEGMLYPVLAEQLMAVSIQHACCQPQPSDSETHAWLLLPHGQT
jgi:hypothetical protein